MIFYLVLSLSVIVSSGFVVKTFPGIMVNSVCALFTSSRCSDGAYFQKYVYKNDFYVMFDGVCPLSTSPNSLMHALLFRHDLLQQANAPYSLSAYG